ncbi:MAG: class I SAM-dependent methyltransferase [Propionibacteriaceae bacterium]
MSAELRAIFDQDAELYDRARPGYPEALFDDLVELGVIGPGRRVLEIGAGTGQATLSIARRGSSVQAVELGAALADRLRHNAVGLPVDVATSAFEDFAAPPHSFDAVLAFTAWHWLTPDVRVQRAHTALRRGGALVTVATDHVLGGSTQFFADAQECYERWDPATPPGLRLTAADDIPPVLDEVDESGLFEPATRRRYLADISYSAQAYLDVLGTYSGHRALSAERRTGLLRCIRELIDGDYGGTVTKRYLYEVRVARTSY